MHRTNHGVLAAAWREVKDGPAFDGVRSMVRGVKSLGLGACVTTPNPDENEDTALIRDAGLSTRKPAVAAEACS